MTGVAVSNVLAQTFMISYVPDHLLGRFSSTLGREIRGTQPLVPPSAGLPDADRTVSKAP